MTTSVIENRIVVDTDVFSYIFRNDARAEFFEPYLVGKTVTLSFQGVAELYFGAYKADWGYRRLSRLESALRSYVVLPYDSAVSQEWARIRADCEAKGVTLPTADLWHAACALVHHCAIATNNARHFGDVEGLTIIAPGFVPDLSS